MHKYGNYFLKSLIGIATEDQRFILLNSMRSIFLDACYSPYGIHPVQAILCCPLKPEEEKIIREALLGSLVKLSLVDF